MPQFWWVNQRHFEYQRESNCHWALLRDEAGRFPFHWENLTKAKVGDIVFSHADQSLKAASVVTKEAYVSAYPDEEDDPDAELGWRLDIEYKVILTAPIPKVDFIDELIPLLQDFQGPINKHKKANLGYFYALPETAGEFLLGLIEAKAPEKIVVKRNPPWGREELILALDYYLSRPMTEHQASSLGIIELSQVLNSLPFHLGRPDAGRFHNPNGCEMKLCNFRTFDPNYKGKGLDAGSKLDKAIWEEFYGRQDALAKEAKVIRNSVRIETQQRLSDFNLNTKGVELLAVDRLFAQGGHGVIRDVYAEVENAIKGQKLADGPKAATREALVRSHERDGLIVKAGDDREGWVLTERGRMLGELRRALMEQGFTSDDLRDVDADVLEDAQTERDTMTVARIGQDLYRARLIKYWNGKCCVSGTSQTELLRASHIIPWSKADNFQRLDPENGLLLNPTYDAAFDRGLITFSSDGNIVLSKYLPANEAEKVGISATASIEGLSEKTKEYLKHHQEHVFKV